MLGIQGRGVRTDASSEVNNISNSPTKLENFAQHFLNEFSKTKTAILIGSLGIGIGGTSALVGAFVFSVITGVAILSVANPFVLLGIGLGAALALIVAEGILIKAVYCAHVAGKNEVLRASQEESRKGPPTRQQTPEELQQKIINTYVFSEAEIELWKIYTESFQYKFLNSLEAKYHAPAFVKIYETAEFIESISFDETRELVSIVLKRNEIGIVVDCNNEIPFEQLKKQILVNPTLADALYHHFFPKK